MKHFFCILLLSFLATTVCKAQYPPYPTNQYQQLGSKKTHVKVVGMFSIDSVMMIPRDTSRNAPDTSIAIVNRTLYQKISGVWEVLFAGVPCETSLIDPITVTYTGDGMKFSVNGGIYQIGCVAYLLDSTTVTLDVGGSNPRKDVFYLDSTGLHILEGIESANPSKPQVDGYQIELTFVDINASATTPAITQTIIFNEGTESNVSDILITPNPDPTNTTNVYLGSISLKVINIPNAGVVYLDHPTLAWDMFGKDALSFFIKLIAVMPPGGSLRIQLFNGSQAIGTEVLILLNKSNISGHQPVTIPRSAFGNMQQTAFTRVRIRYNTNAGAYAGFYLDNMYLQSGLVQPGIGGVNSVIINIGTWPKTGPTTGDVVQTFTGPGLRSQLIRADLTAETDSTVKYVGTINSQTKSANGAVINTATNQIVLQESDPSNNGLTTALRHRQIDTLLAQTIENASLGDTLVYPIDEFRTGVKGIIAGTGMDIDVTDTTITLNVIGGGSGGFFSPDQTATGNTIHDGGNFDFRLRTQGGVTFVSDAITDSVSLSVFNQRVEMYAADAFGVTESKMQFALDEFLFDNHLGDYQFTNLEEPPGSTNKMVIWDSASNRLHVTAISGGGGGSGLFPTTGTGTATGNVIGDLDGNNFSIVDGGNTLVSINPTGFNSSFAQADGTAETQFQISAVTGSDVSFRLSADNGTNESEIVGDAIAGTLAYNAVNGHIFTGAVRLNALAGNGVGVVAVDNDGDLSWTAAGGSGTVNTGTANRLAYYPASNTTVDDLAAITANRALISDANGLPTHATTTATEIGYVNGVTSAIQTQIDSKLGHTTANPAHTGTTPSGAGVIGAEMIARISAGNEFTLANSTSDQTLFPSALDVWTLQGATLYKVKFRLRFTTGSTSHTYAFGFTLGGGASITSMAIKTTSHVTAVNATSTASTHVYLDGVASTIVSAASTTSAFIEGEGFIAVNAGGTFTPIIKFSADPTGTCLLKENSFISFTPVGANTFQSIGNVN